MRHLLWLVALCAMMGAAVGQDPPICSSTDKVPVTAICQALKLTDNQAEGCQAIPFVENVAQNFLPPSCNADPSQGAGLLVPPTTDPHGTVLPQDLPDIRTYRGGLPQSLNYRSFMEAEGSTYYWYWRSVLTLSNWAPCTLGSNLPLPLPTGWTSVGTFSLPPQPADKNLTIPLATLIKPEASTSHERYDSCKRWYAHTTANMRVARATSKRGPSTEYGHSEYGKDKEHHDYDGGRDSYNHKGYDHDDDQMYGYEDERYGDNYNCGNKDEGASPHLVLLIRGTLMPSDWAADLAYSQVVQPELGPGNIAAGFALVAQTLWASGLGEAIRTEISKGCRSITIAGHSLGGAVAQLLAVRIEALLTASEPYPDSPKAAPVTVVTFGSPNVGDSMWADNFNRKINARQISFEGDVVTKIPCEPQIVGCPHPPVTVPTLPGPWSYKRAGANIVYPALAMPFNSVNNVKQSWARLLLTTPQELCTGTFAEAQKASHVCSYLCMTAQYIGMANNMCWLDATVNAPAGASQCNYPRGPLGKLDRLA